MSKYVANNATITRKQINKDIDPASFRTSKEKTPPACQPKTMIKIRANGMVREIG
jgi:hypothetical protein